VALFEMGHVFAAPANSDGPLPDEPEHVALAVAGSVRRRPIEDDRDADVYDAVDAVRVLADALDVVGLDFEAADVVGFRPGRAARVVVDGSELGVVGEVAGGVLGALGLEAPVVAAELSLDALFGAARRDRTFRTPSRFPASTVDLAFALDEAVPAGRLQQTMRDAIGDVLEEVRTFDDFRSDSLGAGRRSLAFALRFRAPDRTLTDADVAELRQRAIDAVTKSHGAQLR
jgi:phenylalanyl-tRNA synthetase beta chain